MSADGAGRGGSAGGAALVWSPMAAMATLISSEVSFTVEDMSDFGGAAGAMPRVEDRASRVASTSMEFRPPIRTGAGGAGALPMRRSMASLAEA